jgi:hypothetical protein
MEVKVSRFIQVFVSEYNTGTSPQPQHVSLAKLIQSQ